MRDRRCIPSRRRGGPVGFTLIELLTVVAIIVLLIAMLLPSLRRAQQQAKQVRCRSNLRSIGQAWHAYLHDFDNKFLKSVRAKDNVEINYGGKQGERDPYRGPKPLNRYLDLPLEATDGAEAFCCPCDRGAN